MAKANALEPAVLAQDQATMPPAVPVEAPAPVREIDPVALQQLGAQLKTVFDRYAQERHPVEQRCLRNLRQYMGIYDPEVLNQLSPTGSRAYPRLTRMKCIAMLSRIMNLMFPGNEDNWELAASPSPDMSPQTAMQAVEELLARRAQNGDAGPLTQDLLDQALQQLADSQADDLTKLIKDQLLELGGDQTIDWVTLNRKVADSGIRYGIGILEGPFVRKISTRGWAMAQNGQPTIQSTTSYKPQYAPLSVWDFYPDMTARTLPGDGYFVRKVLGRAALRRLADRNDFFGEQVKRVITTMPSGNYRPKSWEDELRTMGTAVNANPAQSMQSTMREKYEVLVWKGPVSADILKQCGAEVPDDMLADDVEAEIWMVGDQIIKAEVNAWRKMGLKMQQVHIFNFDEDDTSPVSQGLPYVVRDSQLSICAATRMTLDNASVTCGPNLEVNTSLLRADQDLTSIQARKIWYRDDDGPSAQFPAVRPIQIDGHLGELQALVKMFLEIAEIETFIGPATGGDFQKMPSEPMRTAAGASMLRGDAALPFKDIVRNYDSFTQSVIWSLVGFNRKYNPDVAPDGEYDVIPRGATSLIAKEVRGAQIDILSQTLTPDERDHIDERKFIEAKLASRDMQGMLVSPETAEQRKSARAQLAAEQADLERRAREAEIRNTDTDSFKNVAQGQKNAAGADKTVVEAATTMMQGGDDGKPGTDAGAGSKAKAGGKAG